MPARACVLPAAALHADMGPCCPCLAQLHTLTVQAAAEGASVFALGRLGSRLLLLLDELLDLLEVEPHLHQAQQLLPACMFIGTAQRWGLHLLLLAREGEGQHGLGRHLLVVLLCCWAYKPVDVICQDDV